MARIVILLYFIDENPDDDELELEIFANCVAASLAV
jgi:hypothetical protein